jgi:hypothetical protein
MLVFYLDIVEEDLVNEDYAGRDLPDLEAARKVAAKSVLKLLQAEEKAMRGAVSAGTSSRQSRSIWLPRPIWICGDHPMHEPGGITVSILALACTTAFVLLFAQAVGG